MKEEIKKITWTKNKTLRLAQFHIKLLKDYSPSRRIDSLGVKIALCNILLRLCTYRILPNRFQPK